MKSDKTFKENTNYFKKNDTLKFAGIVTVIVSVILYFFGWSYFSYIIACAGIPAGIVILILGTVGKSKEEDIVGYINKHTQDIKIDIEDNKSIAKRVLKNPAPLIAEGDVYKEGIMIKRRKDGKLRSSLYAKSVIYPLDNALYIVSKTISVVSDDAENFEVEIPYSSIKCFEAKEEKINIVFGKKYYNPKKYELSVEDSNGNSYSMPIENSISTDNFVKKINEIIQKAKEL